MRDGDGGRTPSLVIDMATGTVAIHGQLLELPLREFRLLTALAQKVGQPVSSDKLLEAVWPEDFEWTAKNDLYVLLSKLRRQIDGDSKFGDNIRNRRGFGYILELPLDEVSILEPGQISEPASHLEPEVPDSEPLTEEATQVPTIPTPESEVPPITYVTPDGVDSRGRDSRPSATLATSMALVALLVATSWLAGYWLSSQASSRAPESAAPQSSPESQESGPRSPDAGKSRESQRVAPGPSRSRKQDQRPAVSSGHSVTTAQSGSNPEGGSREQEKTTEVDSGTTRKDPPPPPQPDARLFHLFNPDTGDHYMTISSATANQKQAQGYQSSTVGGVFTEQQAGTSTIALDDATVHIYKDPGSAPAGVSVVPLFRLVKEGDAFYTSSSATANQSQAQGWSRSTVGYVTT